MHYILSYTSCSKFWGSRVGISLMKYYDSHFLFANIFDILIKYIFPGENNLFNIFKIFILVHFVMCFGLYLFPKDNKKS